MESEDKIKQTIEVLKAKMLSEAENTQEFADRVANAINAVHDKYKSEYADTLMIAVVQEVAAAMKGE